MADATELFAQYREELKEILKIDQINVKDVQMRLPAIKHSFVARYIQAKIDLNKLKSLRNNEKDKLIDELIKNSPVTMNKRTCEDLADKHSSIKKINDEIFLQELLVDYLEQVISSVFKNVTFDISNVIKLIELETT